MAAKTSLAFLFILCLAICATALAQNSEKAVKMKDLPEAVRKTVHEQSSGAKLRGLTKEVEDGKTFYEAELEVNGHNKDVLIDPSGEVVEIEEQVPFSSVPTRAQATIKEHAGKGKITVVESITKNNSVEAYEAHVNKAGKRSEIKVTPEGKLIDISKENEKEDKK